MQNRFVVSLAALASIAAAAPAIAQDAAPATMAGNNGHSMEYGIDGGAQFDLSTPKITTISIPVQSFRVGFYINDKISLEPMVSITSVTVGGSSVKTTVGGVTTTTAIPSSTSTDYAGVLGLLWHFHSDPIGAGPYLRPFAGFQGDHSGGVSDTRAIAGGGVGIKLPFGNHMAGRFEANYTHLFAANGGGTNNAIGVDAGLSFFTR
jgi:hypothetical protein